MSTNGTDTAFRIAGTVGLALLLGLVLWARRESTLRAHDHSSPAQHGHDIKGKPLGEGQAAGLVPSGRVDNGLRIVDYDAFQYGFEPNPLVVRAGEKVRLQIKSRDVTHGAMIVEVNLLVEIPTQQRKSVEFTAPAQPGEYPVFCSVFCGPGHGEMRGRLVVLPAEQEGKLHHE